MLPNIKTCENGWSNFSEFFRKVDSYHQIYRFSVIYFNFVIEGDLIESQNCDRSVVIEGDFPCSVHLSEIYALATVPSGSLLPDAVDELPNEPYLHL